MSVGETLRKAREAKGLSIEDVKNSTQIMARQLQEMEEDDFSSCADPFYARHFVQTFARAVGLAPGPVVEEFVKQTAGGRSVAPKPAPKPVVAAAPAPAPEPKPEPPPAAEPAAPAAPAPETKASDDLFSLAAAPKQAPAPATAPTTAPEEPKPAVAPARTTAKVVASTPLAFEQRRAPGPQPEKRVAAVAPGSPAPAPAGPERGDRREGRAEFVPPPAAKKLPEPPSAAFRGAPADGRPVAPEPLPLAGAPFRFPEEPGDVPAAEAGSAPAPAPAAPAPAPVLQSRQRKNLAPTADEEIVASAPAAPAAGHAPAKDEPLFAKKEAKRKREPRPDAPNAAALFLSNLAASARKALSRKPRRGPLLAAAAALVLLCAAGGVYLAVGGRGGGGADEPGETPAPPRLDASVAPADSDASPAPEPPEPIAPVFPPPASWAK